MSITIGRIIIGDEALHKILDFLPYPFLVAREINGVLHHVYINQKFRDEIGYTIEEIPTMVEWFKFAYPNLDYRKQVEENWSLRVKASESSGLGSVSMQTRVHTKISGDRWYEIKSSLDNPHMVAFIDIHANKSREESLKVMNSNHDRVLSILGHDLRVPINQLYSLSEMALKEQITKEEFSQVVANVNASALQSMEFLSTTLTWAKSNFDVIGIKITMLNIKTIAEEVVGLYQAVYVGKNLRMSFSISPDSKLEADREIIITVLRNFVSNAIKFTKPHGSVEVKAYETTSEKIIEVNDSGIGMDEMTMKRILSSDYASSIGTQGEKGLGIGIMLCNDLLKRMNSTLKIDSTLGKGTSMKIVISK